MVSRLVGPDGLLDGRTAARAPQRLPLRRKHEPERPERRRGHAPGLAAGRGPGRAVPALRGPAKDLGQLRAQGGRVCSEPGAGRGVRPRADSSGARQGRELAEPHLRLHGESCCGCRGARRPLRRRHCKAGTNQTSRVPAVPPPPPAALGRGVQDDREERGRQGAPAAWNGGPAAAAAAAAAC